MPENLGLKNGELSPCPDSPNCVSSQEDKTDDEHYIDPIEYSGSKEVAKNKLLKAIKESGDAEIKTNKDNYIHAIYSVSFINFLDDVEFYLPDSEKVIHIRSASRLGHSDFGVNRKRVERIRENFREIR